MFSVGFIVIQYNHLSLICNSNFNNQKSFSRLGSLSKKELNVLKLKVCLFSGSSDAVFRDIRAGTIRGRKVELPYGNVHEFLGLAYAEPPVGALRYKDPVEMKSYSMENGQSHTF
jgi:hypothetical protein